MSALLSAMASSRSSCSCRRSLASLSCSAFSLSRLAHASCCSSLPNCKGKTKVGLYGLEAAATGWGAGGRGHGAWGQGRRPRKGLSKVGREQGTARNAGIQGDGGGEKLEKAKSLTLGWGWGGDMHAPALTPSLEGVVTCTEKQG